MVMVEPLLAALNSLLASPASTKHALLALRVAMSPALLNTASRAPDSPCFRSWKGKERAAPDSECAENSTWLADSDHSSHAAFISGSSSAPKPKRVHRAAPPILLASSSASRRPPKPPPIRSTRHASTSARAAPTTLPSADIVLSFIQRRTLQGTTELVDLSQAWLSFLDLRDQNHTMAEHPYHILGFVDQAASVVEQTLDYARDLPEIQMWGARFEELLRAADHKTKARSHQDIYRLSLWARTYAFLGSFVAMTGVLAQIAGTRWDAPPDVVRLRMLDPMVRAVYHYQGATQVLDFLVAEWALLGRQVYHPLGHTANRASHAVNELVADVLDEIEFPAALMASRKDKGDKTSRVRMGELLIALHIGRRVPEEALAIYEEMQLQSLPVSRELELLLVRTLVRSKAYELANRLWSAVSVTVPDGEETKNFLGTALHLFAHQGDIERVEAAFKLVRKPGPADIGMRLLAYAVKGDTASIVEVFRSHFPEGFKEELRFRPGIKHYTAVIQAHARSGDLDGMNVWIATMTDDGIKPDTHVYDVIATSFAARGELDTVASILDQMRRAGYPPQAVTYTNIISMLAVRRDPVAAEAIYKRAVGEGVHPDRWMIGALMSAHAEAGSWRGVIRAFDYMAASRVRQHRPRIDVYNILLKAYVLVGAPFPVLSDIFQRIEASGVRPTMHTFSLLIQSACDAGLMDVAERVFRELDGLSQKWETGFTVNAYALTIIMAGYLRMGNKLKAKQVYDDMLARGIQPTSVTYGAILRAYASEGSTESLTLAQNFLTELISGAPSERTWLDTSNRRLHGLEHIYGPLMTTFARQAQPAEVEQLFGSMLDAGGEPTLGSLTLLLHAYRNVGDVGSARQVWAEIFSLAQRSSVVDALFSDSDSDVEKPKEVLQRQANILCVPLSIYMDTLSAAGAHAEVARVWAEVKAHHFAFDAHNWNHLAVVLVRAGEPLRAFQILERVILPYGAQAQRIVAERNDAPESPLLFDDIEFEEAEFDLDTPAPPVANWSPTRRAKAVALAGKRAGTALDTPEERLHDFAHPLHILHQVLPSWNLWRPHAAVALLLASVLDHLEAGHLVQPAAQFDDDVVREAYDPDEEDVPTRARRVLVEIWEQNPKAVGIVKEYQQRLRAKEELKDMVEERM